MPLVPSWALRGYPRASVPELDRRVAPALALWVAGLVSLGAACFHVACRLGVRV